MRFSPILASLLLLQAGCAQERICASDGDCDGADEICAFGSCDVVSCNSDEQCGGRRCDDGICRSQGEPVPELAPEPSGVGLAPPGEACQAAQIVPLEGAQRVSVLADVRVTTGGPQDAAATTVALSSESGEPIETVRLLDGDLVAAVPLAPLPGNARVAVRVQREGCVQTSWFGTQAPTPVLPQDHTPRAVAWDVARGNILPSAAAGLLGVIAPDPLRLGLDGSGGVLGYSHDGQQNTCEPTVPLEGTPQNPTYALRGATDSAIATNAGVHSVSLRGVSVGASVDLAGVAVADARQLAHHLVDGCVPGAVSFPACAALACAITADMDLPCGPCDDGQPLCITYAVRALAVPAEPIVPVDLPTLCSTPACSDHPACAGQ